MPLFTRTRTNPIFYRGRLELMLADEPERLEAMRTEPGNLDLLTWNVFSSLDTHEDPDWLAYRLQAIGGPALRAPVRISLFSGGHRAPHLLPSAGYLQAIHERTGVAHGQADGVAIFEAPIEVPVRIETPDVLVLVDTALHRLRRGAGGRDRIAELIDGGLEHARRLSSTLALGLVANEDSDVLTTRVPQLTGDGALERLLPWRTHVPRVGVYGLSWPALLALWRDESANLDLAGQPARGFRSYAASAVG